jgi:hypothetical protein
MTQHASQTDQYDADGPTPRHQPRDTDPVDGGEA